MNFGSTGEMRVLVTEQVTPQVTPHAAPQVLALLSKAQA